MAPKLGESPQSEAQETFSGTPGKDRDAPTPVICDALSGVDLSGPYRRIFRDIFATW
jgi:hypothetical protein